MFFDKRKMDETVTLLLKHTAEGELGTELLEEMMVVISEDIRAIGVSLYGYEGVELRLIASSYGEDNPEWLNAQNNVLNRLEAREYEMGVKKDVAASLISDYISTKVDCAALSVSVGNNNYGYLIADCRKNDGTRIQRLFKTWQEDEANIYYALALLIRQKKILQCVSPGSGYGKLERRYFIEHVSRMGHVCILDISLPDKEKGNGRYVYVELKKILEESFAGYSDVYEIEDGVFCGAFRWQDRVYKERAINKIMVYFSDRKEKPALIECSIPADLFLEGIYSVEKKRREVIGGDYAILYYDPKTERFAEVFVIKNEKDGDEDQPEAADELEVEIVEAEEISDTEGKEIYDNNDSSEPPPNWQSCQEGTASVGGTCAAAEEKAARGDNNGRKGRKKKNIYVS